MKKMLFSLVMIAITIGFIELCAYAAYRIKFGDYNVHDLHAAKLEASKARNQSAVFVPANAQQADVVRRPILHPYTGFSIDGKRIAADCESSIPEECQTRIRVDTDRPFAKRSDSLVIIGILGGSFADGTARGGKKGYFKDIINSIPLFKGKDVVVYNMAMGAYKQPQQLMQLAYYLSLGAEFDIIINLDGFNEISGTFYGWRDAGLHPAFPKSWNHRVSSSLSKAHLEAYSKKFSLLESRSSLAEFATGFPIRWSPTVNFMWRIMDPGYVRRIADADDTIDQLAKPDPENRDFSYEALGPDFDLDTAEDLASYAADVWVNSSLAMRDLAEGHGARYYHFLQPNQYIEGAKPMNAAERELAILDKGGYGNVYKQLYPALVNKFDELRDNDVHFYDLTFMFNEVADTLYVDNCCHLNPKGYDLVRRKIMATIESDFYALPSE